MKQHCPRCRMAFRVEEPSKDNVGLTFCAEPGCDQRFWHDATNVKGKAVSIVGIFPEDAGPTSKRAAK